MHSLWFQPAKVLAGLMSHVGRSRRSGRREHSGTLPSVSEPSTKLVSVPESSEAQTRLMRWISIGEFMSVLKTCRDLIVIDLRSEAKSAPFPVPGAIVLPVAPTDLIEVLECLPPDKSVAFCGASNVSIFLIATSPRMEGSAPLYLLEGDLGLAEVA